MATLPILTPRNATEHDAWHAYIHRVYGEIVVDDIDLNEFTWFYWHAPWQPTIRRDLDVALGEAWVYRAPNLLNINNPETALAEKGFFVNRRVDPVTPGKRVEVVRVSDFENGCHWMYQVKGSGIFVRIPRSFKILSGPRERLLCDGEHELSRIFREYDMAAMTWYSGRVELVFASEAIAQIASPCISWLEYSTGLARPVPLRCSCDELCAHSTPALAAIACVLACAALKQRVRVGCGIAVVIAVACVHFRPRHARYHRVRDRVRAFPDK